MRHAVTVLVGALTLGLMSIAPASATPGVAAVGAFDGVTRDGSSVTVSGWAFDPNAPGVSTEAHVYVDGVGTVIPADQPRPDVNAVFGISGDHGYSAAVPISPTSREVCVFAISTTGGANTLLRCAALPGARPAIGALDGVKSAGDDPHSGLAVLDGWVIDPQHPVEPTGLHVYVTDQAGSTVGYPFQIGVAEPSTPYQSPSLERGDVNAAVGIAGNHGFQVAVPVTRGANTICAFGISPLGGNTLLGCRQFQAGQPLVGISRGITITNVTTSYITINSFAGNTGSDWNNVLPATGIYGPGESFHWDMDFWFFYDNAVGMSFTVSDTPHGPPTGIGNMYFEQPATDRAHLSWRLDGGNIGVGADGRAATNRGCFECDVHDSVPQTAYFGYTAPVTQTLDASVSPESKQLAAALLTKGCVGDAFTCEWTWQADNSVMSPWTLLYRGQSAFYDNFGPTTLTITDGRSTIDTLSNTVGVTSEVSVTIIKGLLAAKVNSNTSHTVTTSSTISTTVAQPVAPGYTGWAQVQFPMWEHVGTFKLTSPNATITIENATFNTHNIDAGAPGSTIQYCQQDGNLPHPTSPLPRCKDPVLPEAAATITVD